MNGSAITQAAAVTAVYLLCPFHCDDPLGNRNGPKAQLCQHSCQQFYEHHLANDVSVAHGCHHDDLPVQPFAYGSESGVWMAVLPQQHQVSQNQAPLLPNQKHAITTCTAFKALPSNLASWKSAAT